MLDPHDLARFVDAQAPVYAGALAELQSGRKRGHWMWFVFPQLAGLGSSPTARRYAIAGPGEARAYLAHPLLGPRLVACTRAVLALEGRSLSDVFGSPDDLKFGSCMTLFDRADGGPAFGEALRRYRDGRPDPRTIALIETP